MHNNIKIKISVFVMPNNNVNFKEIHVLCTFAFHLNGVHFYFRILYRIEIGILPIHAFTKLVYFPYMHLRFFSFSVFRFIF